MLRVLENVTELHLCGGCNQEKRKVDVNYEHIFGQVRKAKQEK